MECAVYDTYVTKNDGRIMHDKIHLRRCAEMQKVQIEKNTVQETLLVPLYGRKMCSEKFPELYYRYFRKKSM